MGATTEYQLNQAGDVIEQTALSAGVGVRVVGGIVLPQFIQFKIQPAAQYDYATQKTIPAARVHQFMALQSDLALKLSANDLRLSQNGAFIVVEMSRHDRSAVYADLLFKKTIKPDSASILGIDETGSVLTLDFANPLSCHALVAGTTGSGKTQLAHAMLYTLCRNTRPSQTGVVAINPKGDALNDLIGNNLLAPVATTPASSLSLLTRMVALMEQRKAGGSPRIIIQADEVADLVDTCPESLGLLTRLAQRGREANLHLLLATQRPDAKAVGALLRANMPARLVGRVLSAEESRMASGYPQLGAEKLNGLGDFILVCGSKRVRFQAAIPPDTDYRQISEPAYTTGEFESFLSDCVVEKGEVTGKDLYIAYVEYCKANDISDILDNTKFGIKIKSIYPNACKHTRTGSLYVGIGLA